MLGRRQAKEGAGKAKAGAAKKRKWQESDSDSEGEAKVTKADLEAYQATIRQEEEEERKAKEKQEGEERDRQNKKKEAEEEQRRKEEEEEKRAQEEAAKARKAAEEQDNAVRRAEDDLAEPGALPPDVSGGLPPGMNPTKMHLYKTTFCKRWEQGVCNFGNACHFAHGNRDFRGAKGPGKGAGAGAGAPRPAMGTMPVPTACNPAVWEFMPPVAAGGPVPVGVPEYGIHNSAHLGARVVRPPGQVAHVVQPPVRPEQAAAAAAAFWDMLGTQAAQASAQGAAAAAHGVPAPPAPAPPGKGQPQVILPPGHPGSGPPGSGQVIYPPQDWADGSWQQPGQAKPWDRPGGASGW